MSRLIRYSTAAQLFDSFETLQDEISSGPSEDDPIAYMTALLKGDTPEDALVFCAYMLPKREAVWWGCNCVKAAYEELEPGDQAMLDLAEKWVVEPEEEHRRQALQGGMSLRNQSPCGWLALAAAWSGGNMNTADTPPVTPPNYLTGQAIRIAVLSAMARVERGERRQYLTASIHAALKLIESQ